MYETMSDVERMTVTLTMEMAQAVRGAVKVGEYASSSEIVREALRDWQYKRELQRRQLDNLRADIQAGLDDVQAGRVKDFNADDIIEKGEERFKRSDSA